MKCELCPRETEHPRGEKAQLEGWVVCEVIDRMGEYKIKGQPWRQTLVFCPGHTREQRWREINRALRGGKATR